jgi:phosphodiesterase/alkaline phosphatase D-like protein
VRRHAKATSAGSTQRQAGRLGRILRGALATRSSSGDAGGAGAPSHRLTLLLTITAALLLAPVSLALAAPPNGSMKVVIEGAGSGEVSNVGGIGGAWEGTPPIECTYVSPGPATGVCEDEMGREEEETNEGSYGVFLSAIPAPGSKFAGWVIEGAEFEVAGCGNPAEKTCLPLNLGAETEITATATFVLAPPVVTNDAPGTITQTSVAMKGHVNNEGAAAGSACKFVIEKEATPGVIAEPACDVTPVTGSTDTAVEATATGLEANTKYVYRVIATSSGGTSTGAPDQPAQTLPNTPVVTNDAPGTITQTSVAMKGHVNNEGAAAGSACKFVIALESAPATPIAQPNCNVNPVTGSTATAVEATASGLSANTKYVYRVIATNSGGTTTGTPDQKLTTVVNAPAAITTAGATAITQTAATLAGTVNPNSGNVTACKIEYGTSTGYGSQAGCASLPGSGSSPVAVSASLSGLTANTTYHFRLVATNAGGTTNGSDQTFTTLANTCATDPSLCPPGPKPEPQGTAKAASSASVSANKASLKLTCTGGACKGSFKLTAKLKQGKKTKTLTIGKGSFSLAAGAAKTLTVSITNGAAKQELGKGKTLKAKLSGTGITASTVKLKPAKKKH